MGAFGQLFIRFRPVQSLLMLAIVCASALAEAGNGAAALAGAGSSAAAPVYRVWAQEYFRKGGESVTYEAVGSGAGMQRIRDGLVDFGASDVIASKTDLQKNDLIMFPTVVSGVVPVVNLPRVGLPLILSGEVLAKILLAEIEVWNAPEIAALNPGVSLPNLPIRVICRSDSSGTTYNFSDYLSKVSPAWRVRFGIASKHAWPRSFIAVKGSGAVSQTVRKTSGAIGYIDYNYVLEDGLTGVEMINAAGNLVAASTASFRAAVVRSRWFSEGDFSETLTNMGGAGSWPITMGTYVAVPRVAGDAERATRTMRFFTWAFANGDALADQVKFIPLPEKVQAKAFREIASVVGRQGEMVGFDSLKVLSNASY